MPTLTLTVPQTQTLTYTGTLTLTLTLTMTLTLTPQTEDHPGGLQRCDGFRASFCGVLELSGGPLTMTLALTLT